jgi:hypothetical protein
MLDGYWEKRGRWKKGMRDELIEKIEKMSLEEYVEDELKTRSRSFLL